LSSEKDGGSRYGRREFVRAIDSQPSPERLGGIDGGGRSISASFGKSFELPRIFRAARRRKSNCSKEATRWVQIECARYIVLAYQFRLRFNDRKSFGYRHGIAPYIFELETSWFVVSPIERLVISYYSAVGVF
jgi:hypothetical protein